jgi:hypothetical protein
VNEAHYHHRDQAVVDKDIPKNLHSGSFHVDPPPPAQWDTIGLRPVPWPWRPKRLRLKPPPPLALRGGLSQARLGFQSSEQGPPCPMWHKQGHPSRLEAKSAGFDGTLGYPGEGPEQTKDQLLIGTASITSYGSIAKLS